MTACQAAPGTSQPAPTPTDRAVSAAVPSAPTAAPVLQKIQVAYPSEGLCCLATFVARDRGFFAANSLEAETLLITSERVMAAIAAGELHYFSGVGTASVAATAAGLPLRAVWVSASSPTYTVFTRPDIVTVDQLRGKRVGVAGFGSTATVAMDFALRHYGVEAARDLVLLTLGADQLRLEALRSGTIDATVLSPPLSVTARHEGLTPLVEVAPLVQMPVGGLTTTLDKLSDEREQVRRIVRALSQAQQWLLQNREDALAMLMATMSVDRATAEGTYEETVPTYQGKGLVTREGIENLLRVLREDGRIGPEVRFEDVADNRLAEEVARELGLIS
jgi:ABC-type nitrate/sulfonate/bicarbonate transport system substrate-binding protein